MPSLMLFNLKTEPVNTRQNIVCYGPTVQLGCCPAVRSLEQRDHHLTVGQEDGAHGSPGDCLVRVLSSVLAMEVIERHPHRRPSGQTESLGR